MGQVDLKKFMESNYVLFSTPVGGYDLELMHGWLPITYFCKVMPYDIEKVKNLLDITHAHLSGQGIPLVTEILEKFGFISNPYQDRFEFGNIHVEHCAIRKICWVEEAPHIKFLHQLQNLVQAKTGKESIFKQ